jgi:hypothetical protein
MLAPAYQPRVSPCCANALVETSASPRAIAGMRFLHFMVAPERLLSVCSKFPADDVAYTLTLKERVMANANNEGTPYTQMKPGQKVRFILKLAICILTFGMAFPNVMSD